MITLIAESKTMNAGHELVHCEKGRNMPAGEKIADEVMANLQAMSVSEIVTELKVSTTMATKILRMAYDFKAKETGCPAIEAFTGVVFKALDYSTLTPEGKDYVDSEVRIISSLYGWLRPDDIVKPYRMDYATRLSPTDEPFSSYWRKDVTVNLVKTLEEKNIRDIINLLPGDAEKCIDKKLVKGFAKIWKVDFKQMCEGGTLRTPASGRLKELRGTLLREMARRNIRTPEELKSLVTPELLPLGTPDYKHHIAFLVE